MAKKLYYKIGEACKELDIQPYVLRYWETEFQALSPSKSKSGQRVYSAEDLELIRRIKELLYKEGYTIAGAKKKLESEVVVSKPQQEEEPVDEPEEVLVEPEPTAADTPDDTPPAPAPKPVRKAPSKPAKVAEKKVTPPASDATVARLEKGIRKALQEAKDILEILDRA